MISLLFSLLFVSLSHAALPHTITIDGSFSDWATVPAYTDPHDLSNGNTKDCAIPSCVYDVHDIAGTTYTYVPTHVYNPGVDILEYKFTHDLTHFYTYIQTAGKLCNLSHCYIITNIDIDTNKNTGYWIHEGGFYPTSNGYDVNYQIEFINGSFNQGFVQNHGVNSTSQYEKLFSEQTNSVLNTAQGNYSYYSAWITWDAGSMTSTERSKCSNMTNPLNASHKAGPYTLKSGEEICFTTNSAAGPFHGQIKMAQDSTGTLIEIACPWSIFMFNKNGTSNIQLNQLLDISITISADATGSTPKNWAADTAQPILKYTLDSFATSESNSKWVNSNGGNALMFFFGFGVGALLIGIIYCIQKKKQQKALLESY